MNNMLLHFFVSFSLFRLFNNCFCTNILILDFASSHFYFSFNARHWRKQGQVRGIWGRACRHEGGLYWCIVWRCLDRYGQYSVCILDSLLHNRTLHHIIFRIIYQQRCFGQPWQLILNIVSGQKLWQGCRVHPGGQWASHRHVQKQHPCPLWRYDNYYPPCKTKDQSNKLKLL